MGMGWRDNLSQTSSQCPKLTEDKPGTALAMDLFMATNQLTRPNEMDFSFLDTDEFKERYGTNDLRTKIRFYVSGIQCEKCIRKLEGLAAFVPGIRQMRVEMGRKLVQVEVNPDLLSFSQVANLIVAQGFEPIPIAREEDALEVERREDRDSLVRLAVAGACAGNIMTFAFAVYFGADAKLFSWLSFALYLPVVTFVAWPFYVGALSSLRAKRVSIDLPLAIASLAGFLFSTLALVQSRPENIYFDSLSGFLFLILIARWTQRRLQRKFLRSEEMLETLKLDRVRVLKNDVWSWRPLKELRIHDRFQLLVDECTPADAELESTRAQFSFAWITGEAKPKTFFRGATIPAGSRLLSNEACFAVTKPFPETTFGQILDQVHKFSLTESQSVMTSDRWAQWLLATVLSAAGLFLIFYWHISPEEAVRRSLALIVLACPCAMAFGTPLALAVSLKKARSKGLILRNANVFEATRSIDAIYFDKTGTLIETDLTLLPGHAASRFQQSLILGLENQSVHPIAFGFRKGFDMATPAMLIGVEEVPGVGVKGMLNGTLYELRRTPNACDEVSCGLFENGKHINEFRFESDLKPNCKATLLRLRELGYRLFLLSGDSEKSVYDLGRKLGFLERECFANLKPKDKADKVSPNVMMVGDGINDSLALMKAGVGVATSGGVGAALQSADVYLTEPSLEGVTALIELSNDAHSLIRQNLAISVIYNSIGGVLALTGFINPFVAAVLMPVSSGFILFSTHIRSQK